MILVEALAVLVMSMLGGAALSCVVIGVVIEDRRVVAMSAPLAALLLTLTATLGIADALT